MTLQELIDHLSSIGGSYRDQEVYLRYEDSNLLHGQKVSHATVVIVADVGGNAHQRIVLSGKTRG